MRMRLAGWLTSLVLHLTAVLLFVFMSEVFSPAFPSFENIYEVELLGALEQPPAEPLCEIEPPPEPESLKPAPALEPAGAPEPMPEPPARPAQVAEAAPPPELAPSEAEPAEAGPAPAATGPAYEPVAKGVVRIPNKYGVVRVPREEWNKGLAAWSAGARPGPAQSPSAAAAGTAERSKADAELLRRMGASQERIVTESGESTTTLVHGTYGFASFADTAALESIAWGEFTSSDYIGHYVVVTVGSYVSIIDAGKGSGDNLVIHDHDSGLTRAMVNERGKIYSYGPKFSALKPTAGTVTFIPKKEDEETVKRYKSGHLFWLPEDPPMRYCAKVLFDPADMQVPVGGGDLQAFVLPPPRGPAKAVLVWVPGRRCLSRDAVMAAAETLALQGVAVVGYSPRGCSWSKEGGESSSEVHTRSGDLLAVVRAVRREAKFQGLPVGVWGEADGAEAALHAAGRDPALGFVVASLIKPEGEAPPEPQVRAISRIKAPLLFILTGGGPQEWAPFESALAGIKGARILLALPIAGEAGARATLDSWYLSQSERFGERLDGLLAGGGK